MLRLIKLIGTSVNINPHSQMAESLKVMLISPNAKAPVRATLGSAGYDLFAAEGKTIVPKSHSLIKTNVRMIIPDLHYGRIAPRSGLALKHGIDVGAGVIDSDYRGDVGVILFNHGNTDFTVSVGDRIAQLILERISIPEVEIVNSLDDTDRGAGSYGSTGK